jgi:hypothetical protein
MLENDQRTSPAGCRYRSSCSHVSFSDSKMSEKFEKLYLENLKNNMKHSIFKDDELTLSRGGV